MATHSIPPDDAMSHVLVVDDDPLICKGLKFNLEQNGYQVMTATNAAAALDHYSRRDFDVAVLDIGLPGKDGLALCQEIKTKYNTPIIFLTARRRELDEIVGLRIGADDYVTKPFSVDILLARIEAVLRRASPTQEDTHYTLESLQVGEFYLDPAAHHVTYRQQAIHLAPREFDLLHFFLEHPDRVFTSDEIIERIWGSEFIGESQVLYVQMRNLREKIEEDPSNPKHIVTLRGVGYKFMP
jgi:DNA-binding response OmpR family regulator